MVRNGGKSKESNIPAEVYKAICSEFNGWEIEKIEFVETPDFKGFEIILEKEDTEVEIMVSESEEITIKEVNGEAED